MLDFGQSINLLKEGKKVRREGWNGKGMFIYYVPANKYPYTTEVGKLIANENGLVEYNPYFAIKNVNGTVSTWIPSINDCLALDWIELQ
jgi:hypothetical protein